MNIGLLSHAISPTDSSIIDSFNELCNIDDSINLNLFTTMCNIPLGIANLNVLPIHEAKYFYGNMIVWSMLDLELCINFPNLSNLIMINNDTIPWTSDQTTPYSIWRNIFTNKKIHVFIKDPNIAEIFKLTWNLGELVNYKNAGELYEKLCELK